MGKGTRRLIEVGVIPGVLIGFAALLVLMVHRSKMESNEKTAMVRLKMFSSAEVTFKTGDLDNNKINDYWVHDVAGLSYGLITLPYCPLIERDTCIADGNTDSSKWPAPFVTHVSSPAKGYWFQALPHFEDYDGSKYVVKDYAQECIHRFGFIAYPDAYGSTGKLCFILSEGGTMYQKDKEKDVFLIAPAAGARNTHAKLSPEVDTFPYDPSK